MKLLLIDDDLACINNLKDALVPGGHECVLFQNPCAALEAFKNENFDVAVVDYQMPEMNGIEVLKEIRKINPRTHVIILTGYADIDNAIDSVNFGAYAFFRKPFNFQEFVETLNTIEEELKSDREKEVNLNRLVSGYNKLKQAFESLRDFVEKLSPEIKEKHDND